MTAAVDHLRKSAKRWLKALRTGDPEALARLKRACPGAPAAPTLRDVQHALARESGYESWIAMARAKAAAAAEAADPLATLLTAAWRGDAARVAATLDAHPDLVNARGGLPGIVGDRAPLHFGAAHPDVVRVLLDRGADPNTDDTGGLTPLDQAALDGADESTHLFLDRGARMTLPAAMALERQDDIDRLVRDQPELISMTNEQRWARLVGVASRRAPGRVIDALLHWTMRLRGGLSVVNVVADGHTPLHAAAFYGNDDAVAVMLQHGADPRQRDRQRCRTPAEWAASAGNGSTADLILGAEIDLFDAVAFDRADRIDAILDADPGAVDRRFSAYSGCGASTDRDTPAPDDTPLDWARRQHKTTAIRALTSRGAGARTGESVRRDEQVAAFLQAACWDGDVHGRNDHRMYDRAAQRMLAHDPSLATASLYTAIVCGDIDEVARRLADRPEAARTIGGARGWTPLLYLAYARFSHPATTANALDIARRLLDHGANPNAFYMAGDARYSVLTGVAAEGEQDAPRQPYAAALFDLLLARGAEPFDIQILYNTHFSGDMLWWLERVYRHTIDTPRGQAWRDPEWQMFDMGGYGRGARFILETAIKTRRLPLADWALAHGGNPNDAPARDPRFPQRSLYEFALIEHCPEMAELLARYGATRSTPVLDERERFLDACLHLDREAVRGALDTDPELRRHPSAMFEAAKRNRADVLAMLMDLGVSPDVEDRRHKRPLHEAAAHDAADAARVLIERGAEVDARESSFDATPFGWASHGDKLAVLDVLARHSRDIFGLARRGYVDRVRQVLADQPDLARAVREPGYTPLWALPDDEAQALEIVELFLSAGADPAAKTPQGHAAADWARRRGLLRVAARLDATRGNPRTP